MLRVALILLSIRNKKPRPNGSGSLIKVDARIATQCEEVLGMALGREACRKKPDKAGGRWSPDVARAAGVGRRAEQCQTSAKQKPAGKTREPAI